MLPFPSMMIIIQSQRFYCASCYEFLNKKSLSSITLRWNSCFLCICLVCLICFALCHINFGTFFAYDQRYRLEFKTTTGVIDHAALESAISFFAGTHPSKPLYNDMEEKDMERTLKWLWENKNNRSRIVQILRSTRVQSYDSNFLASLF